jgi:hypothetical protein
VCNTKKEEIEDTVPYFSWDKHWTTREIRKRLHGEQSITTLAWIMREAKFCDVWNFVSPYTVNSNFGKLKNQLGRKRDFWEYILNEWQKLGKI